MHVTNAYVIVVLASAKMYITCFEFIVFNYVV